MPSHTPALSNAGDSAASAACTGGSTDEAKAPGRKAMGTSDRHRIDGIDPQNVAGEYNDRALGELSDAEIFDQVCPIVARPPMRGLTSFTLHAPLEMMARYGLMRLVDPSDRELARLQMVASAAVYGHQVDLMPAPTRVYSFLDANTVELPRLRGQFLVFIIFVLCIDLTRRSLTARKRGQKLRGDFLIEADKIRPRITLQARRSRSTRGLGIPANACWHISSLHAHAARAIAREHARS